MGPAFYIMAIMGCGEADAPCQTVATVPARYESSAACNAATEDAILTHGSDVLYPVVVAQCRKAGEAAAQQMWADEVKLPNADGSRGTAPRRAVYASRARS